MPTWWWYNEADPAVSGDGTKLAIAAMGEEDGGDYIYTSSCAAGSGGVCPASGAEVGGHCWYLGLYWDNKNCTQVCSAHGLSYSDATRTYAGSAGTNENCAAVLDAFHAYTDTSVEEVDDCWSGAGCGIGDDGRERCTNLTTDAESYGARYRACACE